jgi:hypothetical protein
VLDERGLAVTGAQLPVGEMARRQVRGSRSSRWRAGGWWPSSEHGDDDPMPKPLLCPSLILKQIKGNRRGREREGEAAAAGCSREEHAAAGV